MLLKIGIFFLLLTYQGRCGFSQNLNSTQPDVNGINMDNVITEVFNNCKCVYYYQCDSDNFIITSGESLINIRTKSATRILCKGTFEGELVCCRQRTNGTSLVPTVKGPDEEVDADGNSSETKSAIVTNKTSCGAQKPVFNVRIFTGEDELTPVMGEFPWIAAIYKKKASSSKYKFHCSGSLIHPKVILTANHCVHRKVAAEFRVIVNGGITLPGLGTNTDEERNVTEIIHHSDYYAGALFNDVALLILDKPYVANTNYINTICLPPSDVKLDNTRCLVVGYGKDDQGESKNVMKKVELPFVNFTRCQELLRQTRLGQFFKLHTSFMCAGGEKGKDACKGDGGSPLMCQFSTENRYFQIGIVSWGIGCGQENVPGVYANVQEFAEWIKSELLERELSL